MRFSTLVLLPGLLSLAAAQCPNHTSPSFSCTSAGGNTQITLFDNAELTWDSFNVPAQQSLNIQGRFRSRHLVNGRSVIDGSLTSEGPFTLVSPGGISISGSVEAPVVTLSTLPRVGEDSYQADSSVRRLSVNRSGSVIALAGGATLLGKNITVDGSLRSSKGAVKVIATGTERVSGPQFQRSSTTDSVDNSASVNHRGRTTAPVIEIYSQGFITNKGQITGGRILLEAGQTIIHSQAPGSLIEGELTTLPETALEGPVVRPGDGSNPGGVSTTLGFPDLESGSFTGKSKTTLLPSQFSSSTVTRSRIPAATAYRKKVAPNTRVATRSSAKKKSTRKVKKTSFFGIVKKK